MFKVGRDLAWLVGMGEPSSTDELRAPNFIYHDPVRPDVGSGEGYNRYFSEVLGAFPTSLP